MILWKSKSKLLAGWEIDFENSDELKKILLTHGVDRNGFNYFSSLQTATELIIRNNRIIKVIQHSEGSQSSEKLDIKLPIEDWPDRAIFFLTKDTAGKHRIGGNCPSDFILPKHEKLNTPFIYIATIDTTDKHFDWINLPRLDITYPLYECNYGIFLDYSDPLKPEILNPETFDSSWFVSSIKGTDKVKFKEQRFKTVDTLNSLDDEHLLCGVPLWYQAPDIPICPKTGEVMQFICTINSDSTIDIEEKNGIENLPFGDYLIFADYGSLYVFYQPNSKVLYLNIQF